MKKLLTLFLVLFSSVLLATQYYCPMRCEKAKTYSQPGTCPVCQMNLEPVTGAKLEALSSLDYRIDVKPAGTLVPKQSRKLTFSPRMTKTGEPVKDIQKVRAYIVSQDLSLLDAIPLKLEGNGDYVGEWNPDQPGNFIAYFTFVPGEGKKQTFPLALKVEGTPPAENALKESKNGKFPLAGNITVSTRRKPFRVKPGEKMVVNVTVNNAELEEIELVPLGVSEDTTQLANVHEGTRGEFHVTFPKKGLFKLWLPVKIKNGPLTWATAVVLVN